jgi:hypothetical protein
MLLYVCRYVASLQLLTLQLLLASLLMLLVPDATVYLLLVAFPSVANIPDIAGVSASVICL